MHIEFERFVTGPLETNSFIVYAADKALIVDPSRGCDALLSFCKTKALTVIAIVITHGHFDHIMGIDEIHNKLGKLDVWVHPDEHVLLETPEYNGSTMIGANYTFTDPTRDLTEPSVTIGNFSIDIRHVPGHSPGSAVLLFDGLAIVGDVLFAGSVGRTDFPGCDGDLLIKGIKEKLLVLPPETVVYPGHGNRTTIGREARLNPFLQ